MKQKLGPLTFAKLEVPCYSFTIICLDLTGSYKIKGMVNKRAEMRVWVVIY